ncbi:NAD(P)-dependent alcohol dehydrogenase [Actinopolyspora saharensis]|uniref:NAD(P)-dependent alcohol dehydrogenase n=2 Tax=Actinopolyspora TaxID=1849 RepID=UPI001FE1988B|nr:NAD(P)-dependent alcohol dehydrogenase [Actinopolyspora saharensis]
MCHTDLIVRDQWYPPELPAVLGHEGSGVVEAVGSEIVGISPGDHVVVGFNSCGRCRNCRRGMPAYCEGFASYNFGGQRPDGSSPVRDGDGNDINANFFGQSSFAQYLLATERNVVKVSDDEPLELLGPLGCGISTGAGGILNALDPEAGSSVTVFGAGAVGLSAVMASVVANATTIIAVDVEPSRLQLAQELGATHVLNGQEEDVSKRIMEITDSGSDYCVDTTAKPTVFRNAVESLSMGGTCGLIGAAAAGTEVNLDMSHLLFGHNIKGILEGDAVPQNFIPRLIDLYRQGRFPFDKLVSKYSIAEINTAAADSVKGKTIKPVLVF